LSASISSVIDWFFNAEHPAAMVETFRELIFRLVDNTHTAATELLDDPVMRDGLADHWSRILRL
jgi:hypothetical protein